MKPVTDLKDTGVNKEVILIGGGNSVLSFNFKKISDDIDRIGINYVFVENDKLKYTICDMGVPKRLFDHYSQLIGFEVDSVNYYFDDTMVKLGDHTGYRALQIVQKIMNYKKIYLIGFDYYTRKNRQTGKEQIHYFGDQIHETWIRWQNFYNNREKFFEKHIEDFNQIDWEDNIYNCNPCSKLKKFPYEKPRE